MNYVLANKEKAMKAGFSENTHNTFKKCLVLTEKEVLLSPNLSGTDEEKIAAIEGKVVSHDALRGG